MLYLALIFCYVIYHLHIDNWVEVWSRCAFKETSSVFSLIQSLVAVSKGMQAAKLCSNEILQLSLMVPAETHWPV